MDEPDTLINAYGSRMFQDRGKNPSSLGYKKYFRIFTQCNRTGHTIEVCYRKHGFPPHFGKKGISANSCSSNGNDEQQRSTVSDERSTNAHANITQEQYTQLISLLQQSNLMPQTPSPTPISSSNQISIHHTLPLSHQCTLYPCIFLKFDFSFKIM